MKNYRIKVEEKDLETIFTNGFSYYVRFFKELGEEFSKEYYNNAEPIYNQYMDDLVDWLTDFCKSTIIYSGQVVSMDDECVYIRFIVDMNEEDYNRLLKIYYDNKEN